MNPEDNPFIRRTKAVDVALHELATNYHPTNPKVNKKMEKACMKAEKEKKKEEERMKREEQERLNKEREERLDREGESSNREVQERMEVEDPKKAAGSWGKRLMSCFKMKNSRDNYTFCM